MTEPTVTEVARAMFKARDILVKKFGGPVDLDLVEVLGYAIAEGNEENQELVFTVAQQRKDRES